LRGGRRVNPGLVVRGFNLRHFRDGTEFHLGGSRPGVFDAAVVARLDQAQRIDAEEDELYGDQRGDELPEHLRTAEGRRKALKEAKQKLEQERAAKQEQQSECAAGQTMDTGEDPGVMLQFDQELIVARDDGRQGWLRDARRQLDSQREHDPRPIPASRAGRLLVGERKLAEDLAVERQANEAYEAYRARGVMKDGRRFGGPPKPYVPPEKPAGKVNTSDPGSKNVKAFRGYVQGYNAQAVVTEQQVVIAAEVNTDPQDFSHLGPMIAAAQRELEAAGVNDQLGVLLADAGYWHFQQMDELATQGIPVLIPPDSTKRKTTRPGWDGGRFTWMRRLLASDLGRELYQKRHQTIEPVFGQIKYNRRIDRFQRRGRTAVRSEWRLAAATHNLLKLHQHRIVTAGP
jgi:hypothetical protein